MFRHSLSVGTVVLALLAGPAVLASDLELRPQVSPAAPAAFARLGIGTIILNERADMVVAGSAFPGATVQIDPQVTAIFEIGYNFTPNVAVSFTGGFPPTIDVNGDGVIGSMGRLGRATYGPMTLTAHWHFPELGRIQPYIGAGVAYMHVFGTSDGAMSNLRIDNTFGLALQAGVNIAVNDRFAVFLDVKQAFLRTNAYGDIGGIPASARVVLDPLVISSGVQFRF